MMRRPIAEAAIAGLMLALVPALAQSGGTPISGADAVRLVQQAMMAGGFAPAAMTAPARPLPHCAHAPRVAPLEGNWAAAELICDAPQGWRRVLRTGAVGAIVPGPDTRSAQTPADAMMPVVVLTRPVQRGMRITAQDLGLAQVAGTDPAQHLLDPDLAVGRKLRVALGAGQPVLERHLEAAMAIEPGQSVAIQLQARGLEIAMSATALTPGVVGDRVLVQPASGRAPVEALVIAPGLVRVRPNMPRKAAVKKAKRRLPWSVQSHRTSPGCARLAKPNLPARRATARCVPRQRPAALRPLPIV